MRKYNGIVEKVKIVCKISNDKVSDHFVGADKTIKMSKDATKNVVDYNLSHYACYLIAQKCKKIK